LFYTRFYVVWDHYYTAHQDLTYTLLHTFSMRDQAFESSKLFHG
jgi:hypothetical protein